MVADRSGVRQSTRRRLRRCRPWKPAPAPWKPARTPRHQCCLRVHLWPGLLKPARHAAAIAIAICDPSTLPLPLPAHAAAMTFPWKRRTANDHEAGSSSGRRRRSPAPPPPRRLPHLPRPPRARDFLEAPPPQVEEHVGARHRQYVPKVECQWRREHGVGCEYPDVNLPTGWHLNTERVPVPPPPKGAAL